MLPCITVDLVEAKYQDGIKICRDQLKYQQLWIILLNYLWWRNSFSPQSMVDRYFLKYRIPHLDLRKISNCHKNFQKLTLTVCTYLSMVSEKQVHGQAWTTLWAASLYGRTCGSPITIRPKWEITTGHAIIHHGSNTNYRYN